MTAMQSARPLAPAAAVRSGRLPRRAKYFMISQFIAAIALAISIAMASYEYAYRDAIETLQPACRPVALDGSTLFLVVALMIIGGLACFGGIAVTWRSNAARVWWWLPGIMLIGMAISWLVFFMSIGSIHNFCTDS